jgi:predicted O-methyltransferase YrrM
MNVFPEAEAVMPDRLDWEEVQRHLTSLVPEREPELQLMEAEAEATGFQIIGPAAGFVCYQLTRLVGARRVFELGSGYGYSTAWFARAVRDNGGGKVFHTVWDETLSAHARRHLARLGLEDLVHFHVGEAVAALAATDGPFDLIFNDIDKQGYPDSLPVIAAKLRPGGLLITDNALYHGRVFDAANQTPATRGVREFVDRLAHDSAWISSLLPVRDGLLVALKL